MATLNMKIDGMSCSNCVRHVTEALEEVTGVAGVRVNLDQAYAMVEVGDGVAESALTSAVEEAGYTVKEISPA